MVHLGKLLQLICEFIEVPALMKSKVFDVLADLCKAMLHVGRVHLHRVNIQDSCKQGISIKKASLLIALDIAAFFLQSGLPVLSQSRSTCRYSTDSESV